MIDLQTKSSQEATYTTDQLELLITFDVTRVNRNYEFDNVVFAYTERGSKMIHIPGIPPLELKPQMVIMAASAVEAKVEFPHVSETDPALCFCLELSKDRVWNMLDSIEEVESVEPILEMENSLSPIELYDGHSASRVLKVLNELQELMRSNARFKDKWINLKLEELIICCLQTNMYQTLINSYSESKLTDNPLSEIIAFLKENYRSKVNMASLADKAHMSQATFYRQFKQKLGLTPVEFIHAQRINHAKKLLSQSTQSISEIGYQLGYTSPSYFSLQFEKQEGCSPSTFRNDQKAA
ncbi:MAG: AraC family transcriptional regulator [Bacteroidota bacterium]